jgi:hypothetical protein
MTRVLLTGGQTVYVKQDYDTVVSLLTTPLGTEVPEFTEDFSFAPPFTEGEGRVFIKPQHVVSVHENS